jgi:hypothetical protein
MRRDYDELLITLKTWNKYYTDADELINDPAIDAIYIATPPDTHKYYGLKVALAGKICCIEKPLSPTYHIYESFNEKKFLSSSLITDVPYPVSTGKKVD